MKFITRYLLMLLVFFTSLAFADNTYQAIAKRNTLAALSEQQVMVAKMQGECLVGLKELNFKSNNEFDPIAEWTTYRSSSLLKQFSPCQVLIIMEVAKKQLKDNR